MPLLPTIAVTLHAVAHERLEVAEREPDRAVAEHQHDLTVGMRERGRERVARAHAQAAVRPGIEERARLVAVDELARVRDEVAAVADHDRVAVEALAQLAVDARRLDRRRVGLERSAARPRASRPRRRAAARSSRRARRGAAPPRPARRTSPRGRPRSTPRASRAAAIAVGVSDRWTTCASPKRPKPSRKSSGVPATSTRSASFSAIDRGARERELVVGGQRAAAHAVHEHRHARRFGEHAQRAARPSPSTRRRPRRAPGRDAAPTSSATASHGRRDPAGRDRRPDRPSRRADPGPNASSAMSTNVGPRCGVRATRHDASTSSKISAAFVAVAARFTTGATIGTWSSSCNEPAPQRPCGARPPITTIGEPFIFAAVIALTPFVTPGPAVSAAQPRRRVTFAHPSAANVAVCSWRTSTRRSSAFTAPSYSTKR